MQDHSPAEITFPEGLIGCCDWRHFRLLDAGDAGPIRLLQCLDDPAVGLYVIDPYLVEEHYELEMPAAASEAIGLTDWKEALVLCTLIVRQDPLQVTANLLGPLVINRANGLGVQVVLSGSGYSSRHVLVAPAGAVEC
ncbi:MAG: flagellar assembly protein FliW [Anaerolineae bacterium]